MLQSRPPIAAGIFCNNRVTSDAELFENFAVHYAKLMYNNKKKIRNYLQHNVPRRSPRIAERLASIHSKINKRKLRTQRITSDSNPEGAIPVMRLSMLKKRRQLEFLKTERDGRFKFSEHNPTDDAEITVKNDLDEEESNEIEQCDLDVETNNNQPTYEEVQVRIEQISPATSPVESSQYIPDGQQYLHNEYMYHFEQQLYTEEPPESVIPDSQYGMIHPGLNIPPQIYHTTQVHEQYYSSAPYDLSIPPPSLTPDSSGYGSHQEAPGHPPSGHPPYNAHIQINQLLPSEVFEGKSVQMAEFNLSFSEFCLPMHGRITFNTAPEMIAFATHFLHNFRYDYMTQFPNENNYNNIPQPMSVPELIRQSQLNAQYNERDNDTIQESDNQSEDEDNGSPMEEDDPNELEIIENPVEYMEIDSSSDEETTEAEEQEQTKTPVPQEDDTEYSNISEDTLPKRESSPTISIDRPINGNTIRLRTDLINDGPTIPTSTQNREEYVVPFEYNHTPISYLEYQSTSRLGYGLIFGDRLYEGREVDYFEAEVPYMLGLKVRIPIQIYEIK